MLATVRRLGKHSAIYGMGNVINKALGFFLLPLYTRYLTPADYGDLALLTVTGSVVGILSQFGLGSAMFREVIYQESDLNDVQSTSLFFLAIESTILIGFFILISPLLSNIIFQSQNYTHLLRLIFVTTYLSVFNVIVMARLRIREQSAIYSGISILRFVIGVGLNIYFIVVVELGLEGLILANLSLESFFVMVYLVIFLRELRMTFSLPILGRMLKFGSPLIPANISNLAMTSADRYFLQHFSTTTQVGLYSLGYNMGLVLNLIVQAIQLAWPANLFEIAKQSDAEQRFARILTYYTLIVGFIGLGLSVLAREAVIILTTPEFYSAYIVVPLIVLAYLFFGIRNITNTGLTTKNKMQYAPPIIMATTVLNLVLNYLLIPEYGMLGAAWATLISYIILALTQTAVNLHFLYIPYEYFRLAKIALSWGLVYALSLLINTPSIWINLILKSLLLLGYPIFLFVIRFYSHQEIQFIKDTLTRRVFQRSTPS
jgi:O-antigen/teichoic acid export membrane protein